MLASSDPRGAPSTATILRSGALADAVPVIAAPQHRDDQQQHHRRFKPVRVVLNSGADIEHFGDPHTCIPRCRVRSAHLPFRPVAPLFISINTAAILIAALLRMFQLRDLIGRTRP